MRKLHQNNQRGGNLADELRKRKYYRTAHVFRVNIIKSISYRLHEPSVQGNIIPNRYFGWLSGYHFMKFHLKYVTQTTRQAPSVTLVDKRFVASLDSVTAGCLDFSDAMLCDAGFLKVKTKS